MSLGCLRAYPRQIRQNANAVEHDLPLPRAAMPHAILPACLRASLEPARQLKKIVYRLGTVVRFSETRERDGEFALVVSIARRFSLRSCT